MFESHRPLSGMLRSLWRAAVPVALALAAVQAGAADTDEMTRDLMRLHSSPTQRDFVYWLPAAAMPTLMPDSDAAELKMITGMLGGYELFMVARMRVDAQGHATPLDDGMANDHVRLRLADGRVLEPERDQDLPPVLLRIANAFRPLFDKRGDFGRGLHAAVFRLDNASERPRIDAPQASTLTLLVDDVPVVWHLPLAGAGPAAVDRASGEKFPGNYFFNPYTGTPLKRE